VRLLPDVSGLHVIELGCGTAYVSAWLMRRGARVNGLDNSSRQLATARTFQEEFALHFPLVHADAERAPFADESFDFAISQYGAAIWCDPYRWIPEVSRILRPHRAERAGNRLGHRLLEAAVRTNWAKCHDGSRLETTIQLGGMLKAPSLAWFRRAQTNR
jgi:ubiquinone/menaquinone biosynthesis C-methylase UbiE